jgi:hypothetical protein
MSKQIDNLMTLADEYAKAWHASQTSRLIAAYDDGDHRKALRTALEAALAGNESAYQRGYMDGRAKPIEAALKPGDGCSACPCCGISINGGEANAE